MIDYLQVLGSSLWVLGLALILSALSFAYFESGQHSQKIRHTLKHPRYVLVFFIGFVLFCLGVALNESRWLVRILWAILAIFVSVKFYNYRKDISGNSQEIHDSS